MAIGPVEYMIVAFPGNKFSGEIVPALGELVDNGTIRIIDLAFVIKDADGNVATLEVSDLDSAVGEAFGKLAGQGPGGLLNEEDLEAAAEELDPNSSAALLVWEDLWATRLKEAVTQTCCRPRRLPTEWSRPMVGQAAAQDEDGRGADRRRGLVGWDGGTDRRRGRNRHSAGRVGRRQQRYASQDASRGRPRAERGSRSRQVRRKTTC
jgi:hypothetical protein